MLRPVRDAREAGDFIAGADAVPEPLADERGGVDGFEEDEQAVGEGGFEKIQSEFLRLAGIEYGINFSKNLSQIKGIGFANFIFLVFVVGIGF